MREFIPLTAVKELVIKFKQREIDMSFFTSLTGLNAAVAELGVASNNIANSIQQVSKDQRPNLVTFLRLQCLQKLQLHLEVALFLRNCTAIFSGWSALSENVLDLAITGDGFFRWHQQMAVRYTRAMDPLC